MARLHSSDHETAGIACTVWASGHACMHVGDLLTVWSTDTRGPSSRNVQAVQLQTLDNVAAIDRYLVATSLNCWAIRYTSL